MPSDEDRRYGPRDRRETRWSDDRLDDLARLAEKSDERLDALQNLVAAHDLQLISSRTTSEHTFTMRVAIISAILVFVLTEIGTLITLLLRLPS